MAIGRPTIDRLVAVVVFAGFVFFSATTNPRSLVVLPLILVCTVLVAGYHAYDGGSPRTTILIPIIVAGGAVAGVRVEDMEPCQPPACFPATTLQTYLEWILFAAILGFVVYLVGFLVRDKLSRSEGGG